MHSPGIHRIASLLKQWLLEPIRDLEFKAFGLLTKYTFCLNQRSSRVCGLYLPTLE